MATPAEIAAYLGVGIGTARKYIARGAVTLADAVRMRDEAAERLRKAQKRIGKKMQKIEFGRVK